MDAAVKRAVARRQQILFTLGQTPTWASSKPSEPSVYGPGRGSPPKNTSDWFAFVAAMARRYKGRIQAYEVWNEPDIQGPEGFYNGSPESLVALEAATASALAQEDPKALLLTPAMSGGNGATQLGWLGRYLKAGGGRHAHAVGWHAYVAAPEAAVNGIEAVRQLLKVHNLSHLPVWNTEGGLSLDQVGPNSRFAAGFVSRSMLVDWALGLQRSCWYAYDNTMYEGLDLLVGTDQTKPYVLNPAGKAYQQTMAWLMGARMLSVGQRTDGIWVAELALPASSAARRAWALWSPAGNKSFKVVAAWRAAYWQDASSGAMVPFEAGVDSSVIPGIVPLLIVSYFAAS
jgi:hypothetical protein